MNNCDKYLFSFEPIYTFSGALFAYELVTRPAIAENRTGCNIKSDCGVSQRSVSQKIALFEQQIDAIREMFCSGMESPAISVNIDNDISSYILSNIVMRNTVEKMPGLRFEVNEEITHLDRADAAKWKNVSQYCPVWLDEFGSGNSNVATVIYGNFEYVKINKNFFWRYGESAAFRRLMDHIRPYCKGIIVEGVKNADHRELLTSLEICALQG